MADDSGVLGRCADMEGWDWWAGIWVDGRCIGQAEDDVDVPFSVFHVRFSHPSNRTDRCVDTSRGISPMA